MVNIVFLNASMFKQVYNCLNANFSSKSPRKEREKEID